MSIRKGKRKLMKLEVVRDASTGHVFAARFLGVQATGEGAPDLVRFEAGENQVCEEIEVSDEQAVLGLPELFTTHKVVRKRLVPDKKSRA